LSGIKSAAGGEISEKLCNFMKWRIFIEKNVGKVVE
jgi:hypothetical protein